jgi:2-polyprenyl-6-methoxyphenol hydroxylase-like FAD-dependent oxidoreductase
MLGLLLARSGVDVTVMENHADFLRDFRGDTVYAGTLRLLDELGLADDFARMPHREIDRLNIKIQGTEVSIDLSRIPGPHKNIALVPQWDFLELLAAAAEKEPTFRLLRSTEVLAPIRRGNKVIGVSYRDNEGQLRELPAELTVACEGRSSTLRNAMGLTPRSFGRRWTCGGFGCRTMPTTHTALPVCSAQATRSSSSTAATTTSAPTSSPRAATRSCVRRASKLCTAGGDLRAVARRSHHVANVVRGRQAAGRPAQPAAAPVRRRAVADRRADSVRAAGHLHAGHCGRRFGRSAAKPPLVVRIADKVTALRTSAGYAIAIGPPPEHVPEFARRLANRRRTRADTSRRRAARQSMMSA